MISLEGLTGQVILQGSPGYDEARKNYNGRFQKYPLIIVYCESVQNVVDAILWERKHRIPFRIRCGGHSYEAYSLVDGGLIIDVSRLKSLQINPKMSIAQVGAGYRLLPLYEALWKQGVTIPAGTCPTVGVSGLALGGGYGLLSRQMGMTCDNLLEVEMVTVHGNVIHANHSQYPDLFWACRGGGDGSFGVITSFTFRVHPIRQVAYYRMTWDFTDLKTVVRNWQRWAPYVDDRLTSLLLIPAQNQGGIRSTGLFLGSEEELKQILHPLRMAASPNTLEVQTMDWIDAVRRFSGRPVRQELFKNASAFVYEPLSEEAMEVMIESLKTAPGSANVISFDAYGGSIALTPPEATAFVHRNALFSIQYQSYWSDAEEAGRNISWIEQFRQTMLPYTRGAYRNYCDAMIADWQSAYFGENIARLKLVKKMYDPEDLFRFEQSIPTV